MLHRAAKSVLALLAFMLLPQAADAADRALLIGIGTYASLPENMFLHGPKNDIPVVETLLKDKLGFSPDSIRVLRDEQATRAAILASIEEWLVAGTEAGDRVYFYFSGHGLQVTDLDGDEEDGLDEALSTYDIVAGDGDWKNVILDDEIDAMLAKLKDRAVTLVIDACHSGTISRSVSAEVGNAIEGARFLPRPFARPVEQAKTRGLRIDLAVVDKPDVAKQNGVEAWSAAASYQVAWDDVRLSPEDRQGVFTASYVAGHDPAVADSNGNGLVSNAELLEFVRKQSQSYCASHEKCETLDPQLEVNQSVLGASVVSDKAEGDVETVKVENTAQVAYVAADAVFAVGDILGKAETGEVTISLDKGPSLRSGDVFKISVTSATDGYLVLFDVDKDGKATQIFPNEAAQKITPLTAHMPLTIPDDYYGFDFEADGVGESMLVAIVVSDPLDLSKIAPAGQGLTTELDARGTIADIAAALQKTWTGDTENRGIRWHLGTLKYSIH